MVALARKESLPDKYFKNKYLKALLYDIPKLQLLFVILVLAPLFGVFPRYFFDRSKLSKTKSKDYVVVIFVLLVIILILIVDIYFVITIGNNLFSTYEKSSSYTWKSNWEIS